MAKNDLKLNIKSTFDSDGMKKLDSALKDTSMAVGSTARVIGSVSGELKGMSGEAGKAAGAISGLFSAFTQGGPVALIIAGITTAVGFLVKAFNDAKEAAKTAGEAMANGFSGSIEKISNAVKTLKKNLSETLAGIKKNKDEADKADEQTFRDKAADIKSKYQGLREKTDDKYEKARLRADEEYELAELKVSMALKKQENSVEEATKGVKEREKTLDKITKEREKAEKEVQQYEKNVLNQTQLGETAAELKRLQNRESEAAANVLKKGAKSVARQKEILLMGPGGVSAGTQTVNVTYEDELKDAATELKDFKEKNADAIKQLESYTADLNNVAEMRKQEAEEIKKYKDSQKELADLQAEGALRQKELNTELAGAKEKYNETIKNIDESQKKQQDLDDQKARAEAAAIEAEYERLNREADLNDLKDDLKKQQKKYKEVVEDSAKKLKELNKKDKDLNKALTDLKDQADGTRRSLADMARAAQEGWAGNPNQNLGNFKAGRRGDINNQKKNENQRGKNIGQAQRELARRGANLFDRRGNIKRSASVDDIAKFAETADYLGFKGVSDKTVDKLRDVRDRLKNKLFNKDGSLKNPNDKNSHEMNQYRRIDKALQGKDAADKAERIAKEKKENEKKREKLEEDRTKALEKISDNIDKIKEKMGM